jgi:hypothetical protein
MKKIFKMALIMLAISGIAIFFIRNHNALKNIPATKQNDQPAIQNSIAQDKSAPNNSDRNSQITTGFQAPLDRASERVSKKPFGIYINPATSPVQPERFQGYHAGTDFETFPEEANADVSAYAVCSGKLLLKESASGYGGVAVQSCEAENNPITVIYGHLKLASISAKAGDTINVGDALGILGKGYSAETDGERKHLHLSFHKGTAVNIRGYVNAKSELSGWLDPCAQVCFN